MGLLFHSGSLSSFVVCLGCSVHLGRRLGVIGFICGPSVHSGGY